MIMKKVYQVSRKGKEETPRLFLQHLVCEAAEFTPGDQLNVEIKGKEIIISQCENDKEHIVSVSSRVNKNTGMRRPLIDSARSDYKHIIQVNEKVEVCVYRKKIIIRPLKFKLFDMIKLPSMDNERIKLMSVCAGGGIGTAGFLNTGYYTASMEIEQEEDCCDVLRHNFPSSFVFNGDIRDVNGVMQADVAMVSLPCNKWSNLGSLEESLVTDLTIATARILEAAEPEMIFFENLPPFFTSKLFKDLKNLLRDIYPFWSEKNIESYDYGSIARRNRTYAMAFRTEESFLNFNFPEAPRTIKRVKLKKYLDGKEINHDWKSLNTWMESFKSRAAFRDRNLEKTFVTSEAKEIQCILSRYRSHCATNTYVLNNEKTKWRFFSEQELKRILSIPNWFQIPKEIPITRRYEMIGQSMDIRIISGFANEIAKTFYKIKNTTKKYIQNISNVMGRPVLPISMKTNGQLELSL